MLSLGTAGGLAPGHCIHPTICLLLLCLPEAGSIGLEGWSLEQVPEAAWSALGSQVGCLSSLPRCLSSWQRLLALFPCNHLWLPHCLQEESKLRLQRHLLTNRFGRERPLFLASLQWWCERHPSDLTWKNPTSSGFICCFSLIFQEDFVRRFTR